MVRIRKLRVAALAVPVALAAVAGTAFADPVLVEAMGLDVWHVGQLERDLRASERVNDRFERELQAVRDRTVVHEMILDDVVAGRMSLVEAARQKWEMNRDRAVLRDHLDRYRIQTDYEGKMAYDLLVMALDRNRSAPVEGLKERLEREFVRAYGIEPAIHR